MRLKPLFILLGLLGLFWACAPQKPLPHLPESAEPPKKEVLTGKSIFDNAETLYKNKLFDAARGEYMAYISQYPQGEDAARAWLRLGELHAYFKEFENARQAYQKLIDTHPASPLAAAAMLGKLDAYTQDEKYDQAIQYSFEIPDNLLSPSQLSQKDLLLGDAFLATGAYADAFYFYSLVYNRAADPLKGQTLTKLKEVLPHLDMIQIDNLLRRLTDPVLRGHLLYQLGVLNHDVNRTENAIEALSELIARFPDHERIESAQELLRKIYLSAIESPYTIGCMLPLSGPYETYGNRALKGIELALSQYNRRHSQAPIRIVVKDTASNPYQAVLSVQEFDQEKVAAIIGPIITAEPAAHEAQSRGIPIILFTQKEDITRVGDFVFRNFITPEMQVNAMADFAVTKLGLNRFALLYPDENYGKTFMNLFWDAVLSLGGNIAGVESYDPELTDFAEPIQKLVGLYYAVPKDLAVTFELLPETPETLDLSVTYIPNPLECLSELYSNVPELWYQWHVPDYGPLATEADQKAALAEAPEPIIDFDAVFIPDAPQKAGLIIPQLAYYDIEDVQLIGTNLWHSDKLVEMTRNYIQGAVLPEGFFADGNASHVQAFTLQFERAFGENPGFIEAVAYDSAGILLQFLSNTAIHFKSGLKDELLNMVDYQGVTGRTSFNYQGDALKKLYILRIAGSRFIEVEIP
jgi:ABC-type branched-subunit amino acid transport system substrate-binding protein